MAIMILMECEGARITKSTEDFKLLFSYIGWILFETITEFYSCLFQANIMALVVVAEHSGEFEKIIQLSERCYFS